MSDVTDQLYREGTKLAFNKQYRDAILKFVEILKIDPLDDRTWVAKGVCHTHLKEYQEAYKSFSEALKINPNNKRAADNQDIVSQYIDLEMPGEIPMPPPPSGSPIKKSSHEYSRSYFLIAWPFIAVLVVSTLGISLLNNIFTALLFPIGMLFMAMLSGVFVGIDASTIEAGRGRPTEFGKIVTWKPVEWGLLTFLFLVIFYPFYLIRRRAIFEAQYGKTRDKAEYGVTFACLIIFVIFCLLIIPGSLSNMVHSSTSTPGYLYPPSLTNQPQIKDPIIGVWRFSYPAANGVDARYRFNADGTFLTSYFTSDSIGNMVGSGIWKAEGNNSYSYSYSGKGPLTMIYDPKQNAIYNSDYPSLLLTPYQGDVMTASSPIATPVPTTTQDLGAKYKVGSIIGKDPSDSTFDQNRAWIIVKTNSDLTYSIGQIYYDQADRTWFKVDGELPEVRYFHAVERDYPRYLGITDWNTIPTKYPFIDEYGTTKLQWKTSQPTSSNQAQNANIISGTGDDVVSFTIPRTGLYIFDMQCSGKYTFMVTLKDEEGSSLGFLGGGLCPYSGKKSMQLPPGKYYLDISAIGDPAPSWSIQIISQ